MDPYLREPFDDLVEDYMDNSVGNLVELEEPD